MTRADWGFTAVCALLLAALAGCPSLGPVTTCEPTTTRCSPTGNPEVCSGSRRWTEVQACAASAPAGVCCWVPSQRVHSCLVTCPVTDGGAP